MYGTPKDVIEISGVTPEDLGLTTEYELNELLTKWIRRISAAIDARLEIKYSGMPSQFNEGLIDVCTRTVSKLVALAKEQRVSNVFRIGEFTTGIINSSEVINGLDAELEPYKNSSKSSTGINTRKISIFTSF